MSRFRGNLKRTRLPNESRRLPHYGSDVRGDGLDHDKWFTCWYCGWRCNVERDGLGDSQSRHGMVYEDYAQQPDPGYDYAENQSNISKGNYTAVLGGGISFFEVAGENDSEGDPKSVKNAIRVKDSKGCPLCGTKNWRGDYF